MTHVSSADHRPAFISVGGIVASFLGLGLFIYFVQRAGLSEIVIGIRRLGWTFLLVAALGGLRLAARAQAWRACFTGEH